MKKDVSVSIYCITYNHANFIRKTLDGFLMQKTNFNYEIIIHDDASTDGTIEILKEYQSKYPDKISLILEKENLYAKTGSLLEVDRIMFSVVRGKYTAFCEGDDLWLYKEKLQFQYDIMEKNENIMLCVHNAIMNNMETGEQRRQVQGVPTGMLDIAELVFSPHGNFPTASFFLRSKIVKELPDWYYKCPVGDDVIRYLSMNQGDVYYIDETWSLRNFLHNESWNYKMKDNEFYKKHLLGYLDFLCFFDDYSNGKFADSMIRRKQQYVKMIIGRTIPKVYMLGELNLICEELKKELIQDSYEQLKAPLCEKMLYAVDYWDDNIGAFIAESKELNKKLYLYGVGDIAQSLARQIDLQNANYEGFVVSDGHRKSFDFMDHHVCELNELNNTKDSYILVCLNSKHTWQVLPELMKMGVENVLYPAYDEEITWIKLEKYKE